MAANEFLTLAILRLMVKFVSSPSVIHERQIVNVNDCAETTLGHRAFQIFALTILEREANTPRVSEEPVIQRGWFRGGSSSQRVFEACGGRPAFWPRRDN